MHRGVRKKQNPAKRLENADVLNDGIDYLAGQYY